MSRPERISFHVPYDLVPLIKVLAEQDGTPPCKWLGEVIRREVRQNRQKLINAYSLASPSTKEEPFNECECAK